MKREINQSSRFKRQMRIMLKRGKDETKIRVVIEKLLLKQILPLKYQDHQPGKRAGSRECHIEPDWLLVYRFNKKNELDLIETGSHADLY